MSFFEKYFILKFLGQKGYKKLAQIELFQVIWKINALNFFYFWMNLQQPKGLKLAQILKLFWFLHHITAAWKLKINIILTKFFFWVFWSKKALNRANNNVF